MTEKNPVLFWFRRDLRLHDNPALNAALDTGRPVIPVFVHDEVVETHGAAPKWRLGLAVEHIARTLEGLGARLILRRGKAVDVLSDLVSETGASAVYWSRLYDPDAIKRDTTVKKALKDAGTEANSFPGHLLFEPWAVETKTGGFYKVYTPMWRSVSQLDPGAPLNAPSRWPAPENWPSSEKIENWRMAAAMNRGAEIVRPYQTIGEDAARDRLYRFISEKVDAYARERDLAARPATSGLSENLTYGEISPRVIWAAGQRALEEGAAGAETFLKELVWREFAYHLSYHTPHLHHEEWRPEWKDFPWRDDPEVAERWRRGQTGVEMVDAGMREMYVTGTMHNRVRMITASYLTKHMLTDWRIGRDWFADCLTDWDPASNSLGWQWVAGCGPDATPYFRVFNPATQAEKFDAGGEYRRRWLAEGQKSPPATALSFFDAIPHAWRLSPDAPPPQPDEPLSDGRQRALAAYERWKGAKQ